MNKISVIIPVYNSGMYLQENIDSIRSQTYTNLEIIYIDDGSSDESCEIVKKAVKEDSRIRLIESPHTGVSAARNLGLNQATGEYISFVDSDDLLVSDAYEKMMDALEENYLLCFSYMTFGNELIDKEEMYKESISQYGQLMDCKTIAVNMYQFYNIAVITSSCTKLFSKKIINLESNKIRFNQQLFSGEDCVFVLEYLRNVKGIKIISDSLYRYRIYGNQSINKHYKHFIKNYSIVYDCLKTWVYDQSGNYEGIEPFGVRWINILERGCWEMDWKDKGEIDEFVIAANSEQTENALRYIKRCNKKLRIDKIVFSLILRMKSIKLLSIYGGMMRKVRKIE